MINHNFDIRRRVQATPQRDARQEFLSQIDKPEEKSKKSAKFFVRFFIIFLILFIILGLILIFFVKKNHYKSEWQAVFLTNNRVYFGKVVDENREIVILKTVYYLSDQSILYFEESNLSKIADEFALIKKGDEIHGPQDEMLIFKANILHIDSLKEDSKVVKAIKDDQAKKR